MILVFLTAAALAGIVPPESPEVGVAATIQVVDGANHPIPGTSVRIVYRPGLHSAHEVNAGLTDGRGSLSWTPEVSGPVVIRALEDEARVVVPATSLAAETLLLLMFSLSAAAASIAYGLSPFSRAS